MAKDSSRDSVSNRIPEWRLQAEIAAHLDKIGQPYAASLEGVRLNPYQARIAQATGMKAGEPDIRLYFDGGRVVFIELKGDKGYLNKDQKERIPLLRGLGFVVHVVRVKSCEEAVQAVQAILDDPAWGAGFESAKYFPRARKK